MQICIWDLEVITFYEPLAEAGVSMVLKPKRELQEGDNVEIIHQGVHLYDGVVSSIVELGNGRILVQAVAVSLPSSGADCTHSTRAAHSIRSILSRLNDWEREQALNLAGLQMKENTLCPP